MFFFVHLAVVFADATDRSATVKKMVPTTTSENIAYNLNVQSIQRRGSMPCDGVSVINRNGCNGKNRNSRKKLLRRRSSGGAEILGPIIGEVGGQEQPSCSEQHQAAPSSSWFRFKRDITRNRSDLDTLLSRRRGSLPVEMLSVSHSG